MARITHHTPTEGVIRAHFDVTFVDGVADVDLADKPNLEKYYRDHGYTIEDGGQSKGDLQKIADGLGIEYTQRTTRAELADLIADRAVPEDRDNGGPAVITPEV